MNGNKIGSASNRLNAKSDKYYICYMQNKIALLTLSLSFLILSCQKSENSSDHKFQTNVTVEDVEAGIRANIAEKTREGKGYFNFKKDTIELSLKLVRVHTEYLSVLGPNEFFACVDLATESGDVYDVDFFMKGDPGNMELTRMDVHKLNGKPYYTWKQTKDKTWVTVPVKNASNRLLGVVEGQDQFNFTYSITIPQLTSEAQMWVPIAKTDDFQQVELTSFDSPVKYEMLLEEEFGNTIAFFYLKPENSGERIEINYKVERIEKSSYKDSETDPAKYLGETAFLPVGDRFSEISQNVIKEKQANTPLTKARALYDYIIDEMRYAKQGTYGTGDANYACDSKSGNCTEFHSFFISLARSAGIPARFAVGAAIPSERNEGGVNGYHCWAEFYAEGKWWPVDISEANKYTALATYYFGHHPANRIEFSSGRDLKPVPTPKSGPINFLAYPVLEAKENPGPVKTKFTFERLSPDSEI